MEPLGHAAIRLRHLGDFREHVVFPVRLVSARAAARFPLQLLGTLLHRSSFLVHEPLGLLVGRGGVLADIWLLLLTFQKMLPWRSSPVSPVCSSFPGPPECDSVAFLHVGTGVWPAP